MDKVKSSASQLGLSAPKLRIIDPDVIPHVFVEPGLGASIELIVSDPKNGLITEHRGPMKSESFVKQFLQLLFVKFAQPSVNNPVLLVKDTGNTDRSICETVASGSTFMAHAAITDVLFGIIIGTGNTAPTITDYKIETIIPHATMNYSAMTFGTPAADATTSQITLTRLFSNVSGGPVTVNEAALYVRCYDTTPTQRYFMIIRDVIAGGISVPNGQTLTVNYRPQAVI
jgi:hypothetical protein